MREHPIIFSGPMVKAILDGSKTQTRRVMKRQPIIRDGRVVAWRGREDEPDFGWPLAEWASHAKLRSPFRVGQKLWVRETWSPMWSTDCNNCDGDPEFLDENGHCEHFYVEYRADTGHSRPGDWPDPEPNGDYADAPAWKPSIHMFRWASRITLEVTDVRIERVQDISEEDAKAEGAPKDDDGGIGPPIYVCGFLELWNSINAKRGYGWDMNPWCWVVGFKVIGDKGGLT